MIEREIMKTEILMVSLFINTGLKVLTCAARTLKHRPIFDCLWFLAYLLLLHFRNYFKIRTIPWVGLDDISGVGSLHSLNLINRGDLSNSTSEPSLEIFDLGSALERDPGSVQGSNLRYSLHRSNLMLTRAIHGIHAKFHPIPSSGCFWVDIWKPPVRLR